ncbi:ATP-binding protein [Helicobacter cappadocius]|uniref:ATP-binding protein n=1 Tax=Helicobacter cappadocius TaxID=3063998 RepID=A0AA90TC43_9HELI|nr:MULTISPECIES: ATP-binding protein [unclassified Helicobacter]MDO7253524.1 ATP-binding protein [Helicobacter sp. faydin-H75]MDP2539451.1 ATP-binding protein [Helicobacter sp. faydin-H76]
MEEYFLEKIQNFTILPRRFGLKGGKIHLFGCAKSGKTSIALDFAQKFKNPIYIDCNDPRINVDNAKSTLLKYYLEKKIDILIVDNFFANFTLPKLENIILISRSKNICLPNDFLSKQIYPLSFEEYISFDRRNLSINTLFNHFLKDGNLPEMQYLSEYQKISRKQEINSLVFGNNVDLFKNIISYQSRKITINQLYMQIKKQLRISKDKIYSFIDEIQSNGMIYLLSHMDDFKKPKKIYFYDFSISYAFCADKSFQAIFENMVFLELLSRYKAIHYTDNYDFITEENHVFACIPFPDQRIIEEKIRKSQVKHSKTTIITINYDIEGKTNDINWRAVSFMNFALEDS